MRVSFLCRRVSVRTLFAFARLGRLVLGFFGSPTVSMYVCDVCG